MRDIEAQFNVAGIDTDLNEPLLNSPKSTRSSRRSKSSNEVIQLDDIPPIIKSANGNIFWADEQCTRRVGLTSSEARMFLCLLQTDESDNYNYAEYKALFDDFGREQERLQELVDAVPWWDLHAYRQNAIWEARIQWLDRMIEPRLWLLYLMARRRRILKQAADRVLCRLREKRLEKIANSHTFVNVPAQPHVTKEAVQNLEQAVTNPTGPVMISEESQTSETHLNVATNARSSMTEKLRSSFSTGRHSHHSDSHFPVIEKRFMATRENIKHQVEKLMPKHISYLVIGWFPRSASDPFEKTLQFEDPARLFKALRHGERFVRGWRRFLSLRTLRGFGLYKCDISRGAHLPLDLSSSQQAVLSQFFLAYKASNRHSDAAVASAWQGWVHKNLNNDKNNPLEGWYSLQLVYEWSSYRLCVIVIVPLVLSFALGLWYMLLTGDVVTAWTIALYIVTAAAALVALMTIIGGLKDI